ncbi:MAG TPA: hypothetical protein PLO67_03895 [Saprospiraceae bacterium]|nr:hypothetical protein [Saprospiraceae bacterium]HPI05096.1 hypothetical protein [Saprospiraceae bacterium]
MKHHSISLILAITIFLLSTTLHAQKKNAASFTVLPLTGKLGIQYERVISPHNTLVVEYQHWETARKNDSGFFILGVLSSSSSSTRVSGNRLILMSRLFMRENKTGFFLEGGIHTGKFDIVKTEESSYFSFWGFWTGDFAGGSRSVTRIDNVKFSGMRGGLGWRRQRGRLSFDFTVGMELGDAKKEAVKLAPGLRFGAPYSKLMMGFHF